MVHWLLLLPLAAVKEGSIRLIGADGAASGAAAAGASFAGRVELFHAGLWGTIIEAPGIAQVHVSARTGRRRRPPMALKDACDDLSHVM